MPDDINLIKTYSAEKVIIHENFKDFKQITDDIALIKLQDSVPIETKDGYYITNGICLPEKNIINNDVEFAILSGYGYTRNYYPRKLQKGFLKIYPSGKYKNDKGNNQIISMAMTAINESDTCQVYND